jgi:hypothetical protein
MTGSGQKRKPLSLRPSVGFRFSIRTFAGTGAFVHYAPMTDSCLVANRQVQRSSSELRKSCCADLIAYHGQQW